MAKRVMRLMVLVSLLAVPTGANAAACMLADPASDGTYWLVGDRDIPGYTQGSAAAGGRVELLRASFEAQGADLRIALEVADLRAPRSGWADSSVYHVQFVDRRGISYWIRARANGAGWTSDARWIAGGAIAGADAHTRALPHTLAVDESAGSIVVSVQDVLYAGSQNVLDEVYVWAYEYLEAHTGAVEVGAAGTYDGPQFAFDDVPSAPDQRRASIILETCS
jgi:hypothetical protein